MFSSSGAEWIVSSKLDGSEGVVASTIGKLERVATQWELTGSVVEDLVVDGVLVSGIMDS